jgi:sarcosine oxidase subunit gamma
MPETVHDVYRGDVAIEDAPPLARWILRGSDAAAGAGRAMDLAVPTRPLRSAAMAGRAALWLGPDEWLLLAPQQDHDILTGALAAALAGTPHSLVDVSHRQVGLLVEGEGAALALAAAVPLDLDEEAFPVGMVARTIFEKAEIVLWRTAPHRFHLEVWRSFAPYVRDLLDSFPRENAVA